MHRPSLYSKHDETLKRFAEKFNSLSPFTVEMVVKEEDYKADGFIKIGSKVIGFDWECRDTWWESGIFPFRTLRQFERKFNPKHGIDITVQCNRDETHFAFALHTDFDKNPEEVTLETDSEPEEGKVRNTNKFWVYSYGEIDIFKEKLLERLQPTLTSFMTKKEGKN